MDLTCYLFPIKVTFSLRKSHIWSGLLLWCSIHYDLTLLTLLIYQCNMCT